jgi:mono/diheme cytochrome c family protein
MRTDLVAGRACRRALRWRLARFLLALSIAMAPPLSAQSPAPPAPSRGALLYETHCVACHTTQVHWRDRKLATDWSSLSAQVRRWQANAGLRWTDEEIDEVVRYLNTTVYRFPEQAPKPIG